MNEDFGVGRRRPTATNAGPYHHVQYNSVTTQHTPGSDTPQQHSPAANKGKIFDTIPAPVGALAIKSAASADVSEALPKSQAVRPSATSLAPTPDPQSDKWYRRIANKLTSRLSRKQWLAVAAVLLVLIGGATAYAMTRPDEVQQTASNANPKPKPVPPILPVSALTGIEVSAEDAKHIVTGVMIDNSANARPQSGLQQAGVVYEAIAEYGITRFLALYQEAKPANIGPIRSVRPYYADWAKTYDAPIAHVGGSPDALAKIRNENIKDLDQFANAQSYRRISSRFAPHNVYTTMTQLNENAAGKGWTTSKFTSFPRKKDEPRKAETPKAKPDASTTSKKPSAATAPTPVVANKINIAISGPTYNVQYDYDAAKNRYLRTMGGAPHVDADSQERIAPRVVIGIVASYGLEPDGLHSVYQTTGRGKAYVFQDGTVNEVTWNRPASGDQYSFVDSTGKQHKLNAGQTWITIVGTLGAVAHTP